MSGVGRWIIGPAIIAGLAIVVIVAVALWLPGVCPTIYPLPASCRPDVRVAPAVIGGIAVLALFALLVMVGVRTRGHDSRAYSVLLVLLVVASVAGLLATVFSGGFLIALPSL